MSSVADNISIIDNDEKVVITIKKPTDRRNRLSLMGTVAITGQNEKECGSSFITNFGNNPAVGAKRLFLLERLAVVYLSPIIAGAAERSCVTTTELMAALAIALENVPTGFGYEPEVGK